MFCIISEATAREMFAGYLGIMSTVFYTVIFSNIVIIYAHAFSDLLWNYYLNIVIYILCHEYLKHIWL